MLMWQVAGCNGGEAGYRDTLCDRIGQTVRCAATEGASERTVIEFADETIFAISLRDEDFDGPEAAAYYVEYYHDARGQHIALVVWQEGWREVGPATF